MGAPRATYAQVMADVGNTLLAIARYNDGQGTAQTATNAASAVVTECTDGHAAPAFQPAHYTVDLPENTTPTALVTATVTDGDAGEMLNYAMTMGVDADRFALVPTGTGVNLIYIGGASGEAAWQDIAGATGPTYGITPSDNGFAARAGALSRCVRRRPVGVGYRVHHGRVGPHCGGRAGGQRRWHDRDGRRDRALLGH